MIGRRGLLAGTALAAARPARAAAPRRIVMLLWRGWEEACDGFRDFLATRHPDVEYIVRDAEQTTAPIPDFVAEIKRMKPDLVFVWGGSTALAALGRWDAPDPSAFLQDIPAVLAIVADPLGSGLVRDLERPGRPVTGTIYVAPMETQVRAMQAYRPFRRVATLWNPLERSSSDAVEQLAALASRDRFLLTRTEVPLVDGKPSAAAVPGIVRDARAQGAEWLYIPPDTFLNDVRMALTQAALDERLPAFSATERFVTYASGLAGLVCRYYNIGQFAGFKAAQILDGVPAGTIPIQTLTRFSLLIRMATAKQLSFFPPMSLLRYAEAV